MKTNDRISEVQEDESRTMRAEEMLKNKIKKKTFLGLKGLTITDKIHRKEAIWRHILP